MLLQFVQFLFQFIQNTTGLNWVDVVIILVLLYYSIEGYLSGFVNAALDFLTFILSFTLGLKFYALGGKLIVHFFPLPQGVSNALGFFLISFLVEIILHIVIKLIYPRIMRLRIFGNPTITAANHTLGILPGVLRSEERRVGK